ncbi:MAG: HesA/MoeB/ThiF family protein [Spirochaetaceae bacterium]|nr:HesA/MoeB/ThiF family protein [Spirochaetaceae bacterium]
MVTSLAAFLADAAREGLVPWSAEADAAARFGVGAREVESEALAVGLLPARYARNAGTFGLEGQRVFHAARVVVAGCGGLGGHLVENLARLGIGTIVAVDPECFEESNLNRQALCAVDWLGKPKVEAAAARVAAINPAVRLFPLRERLSATNARVALAGADAVADGLDSIPARLEIARACSALGIAFVHASVAGWYAQAATQMPGGETVAMIYRGAVVGDEARLGNQSFAPALAAAIQTAEICKIILGLPPSLADRLLAFDLLAMEAAVFPLG